MITRINWTLVLLQFTTRFAILTTIILYMFMMDVLEFFYQYQ